MPAAKFKVRSIFWAKETCTIGDSGRGAAWLARLLGVQEVPSSNLGGPTKFLKDFSSPSSDLSLESKLDAGRHSLASTKKAAKIAGTSLLCH